MCIFQLIKNIKDGKVKKKDAQIIFDLFEGKEGAEKRFKEYAEARNKSVLRRCI